MISSTTQPQLYVGARIAYKGNVGTIRYIGNLDGYPDSEVWAGIEWDDFSRGKHSGSHNNKHYFKSKVPNAASFVKATKLGNGARITLVEAARQRIAVAKDHSHREAGIVVGKGVVDIADEGCAVDQLSRAELLDVSNMGVATVRSVQDEPIAQILPQLMDLSIAHSLISDVLVVIEILCSLPKLETLDASHNYFCGEDKFKASESGSDEEITRTTRHKVSKVTELILNNSTLEWKGVAEICKHVEALTILRLYTCGLKPFQDIWKWGDFETRWASLQVLDLDGNHICWEDVHKLSQLPSLKELFLSDNGLEDTHFLDDKKIQQIFGRRSHNLQNDTENEAQATVPFGKLHTLSIARNQLRGWTVITSLNTLPALTHLRMIGNPISPPGADAKNGKGPHRGWHLRAVARIGKLVKIDGSNVSLDERLQAERRYLQEEVLPSIQTEDPEVLKTLHPRCEELIRKLRTPGLKIMNIGPKTSIVPSHRGSHQEGLAADSIHITLIADKRIRANRQMAVRVLPRTTQFERLVAMARVLLRMEDISAGGSSCADDAIKLGVTVRIGEGGVAMTLCEGQNLSSLVNRGDARAVEVTLYPKKSEIGIST